VVAENAVRDLARGPEQVRERTIEGLISP